MAGAVYETDIGFATPIERRGDVVVAKWVDKNSYVEAGSILVGTGGFRTFGNAVTGYVNVANVVAVNTPAGQQQGLPLVFNGLAAGAGGPVAYAPLPTAGIANAAVTDAKIANATINAISKLAAPSILMEPGVVAYWPLSFKQDGVMTQEFVYEPINGSGIAANAINSTHIDTGSITTAKFAASAKAPYAGVADTANLASEARVADKFGWAGTSPTLSPVWSVSYANASGANTASLSGNRSGQFYYMTVSLPNTYGAPLSNIDLGYVWIPFTSSGGSVPITKMVVDGYSSICVISFYFSYYSGNNTCWFTFQTLAKSTGSQWVGIDTSTTVTLSQ